MSKYSALEARIRISKINSRLTSFAVVLTAVIQFLLWHDSRKDESRKFSADSSEVDSEGLVPDLSKDPDLKGASGGSRVVPDLGHQV